jgi:NADH dehydrogenase [ubiquinone] 1 alpha subcomplex assembly factor 5
MVRVCSAVKRQQRNNIAAISNGDEYEYLKDEVARRLVDRLEVSH